MAADGATPAIRLTSARRGDTSAKADYETNSVDAPHCVYTLQLRNFDAALSELHANLWRAKKLREKIVDPKIQQGRGAAVMRAIGSELAICSTHDASSLV